MKAFYLLLVVFVVSACGSDTDNPSESATNNSGDANLQGSEGSARPTPRDLTERELLRSLEFPAVVSRAEPAGMLRQPKPSTIYNAEAVIPPQCYTKHEAKYNPCMTCHQTYPYRSRPNTMDDGNQQVAYIFSDIGETNHWVNLFEDRRARIQKISDQEVVDYIYTDNYGPLIEKIKNTADWEGPVPEIENLHLGAEAFDKQGFARDGSHWVAFNYKPLPSTFWPTNGSTDDVMIRLPARFRLANCGGEGEYSRALLSHKFSQKPELLR